jgi:hypothetical protein
MHIGTMRNTMSTCAKYGIVGVPITIFFQCCFSTLVLNSHKRLEDFKASMSGFDEF